MISAITICPPTGKTTTAPQPPAHWSAPCGACQHEAAEHSGPGATCRNCGDTYQGPVDEASPSDELLGE